MEDIKIYHERNVYTIIEILGRIWGLQHALTGAAGVFFLLYSQNSMTMEQAKFLFVLKLKDAEMLNNQKKMNK